MKALDIFIIRVLRQNDSGGVEILTLTPMLYLHKAISAVEKGEESKFSEI